MTRENFIHCEEKALELLKEHEITKPFVNVFYIAEREGFQVNIINMPQEYFSVAGLLNKETKSIYVNADDPANRQTFTVAHELGHYMLGHNPNEFGVLLRSAVPVGGKNEIEKEADVFAANLLVPKKMLMATMDEYKLTAEHVDILARMFAVSSMMMTYRIKWLGVA